MECKMCLDDMETVQVLYKLSEDDTWHDFPYCSLCLEETLNVAWNIYINGLKKTDCKKTLRLLIQLGPPHHYRDTIITDGKEIHSFCYNNTIIPAKLNGSLDMEEIELLKKDLLPILDIIDEKTIFDSPENNDYMLQIKKTLEKYNL